MLTPSISQLKRALGIQEQIEKLEAELKTVLSGDASLQGWAPGNGKKKTAEPKANGKRTMSASARARIAAAQRARWAKSKGVKGVAPVEAKSSKSAKKAKRKISPEARAKMAAAAKKRWAKVKKAK